MVHSSASLTLPAGLRFGVASGKEVASALELRRQIYLREFGHEEVDAWDSGAVHLMATRPQREVVAVARMVLPEQRPFLMERFVDFTHILGKDAAPAEIGRFVIRDDYRRVSRTPFVHLGMLRLAVSVARDRGVTHIVLYSLPHLFNVYRAGFFKPLGLSFAHPRAGCVHVMCMDVARVLHEQQDRFQADI